MAQPPWDGRMELSAHKPFYILHYTYGNDFNLDGKFTPGGWVGGCVAGCFPHAPLARGAAWVLLLCLTTCAHTITRHAATTNQPTNQHRAVRRVAL
jgi:hypothetical protein